MQDIVILVPSETPETRDFNFEERIATLATQWSQLVEWVHTHYAQLQNALLHWRHFEEEADMLDEWLSQLEKEALEVESNQTKKLERNARKVSGGGRPTTEEEIIKQARSFSEAVSEAVMVSMI